jgi:hypothetical protein
MRLKTTLCSLLAAASLSLAVPAKNADAEISTIQTSTQSQIKIPKKTPPWDISKKVKKFVLKDPKDLNKQSAEYSLNMAWMYSGSWYKGLIGELSTKERNLWFTLGVYANDRYDISTEEVDSTDIVSVFLTGPLLDKHTRKDTRVDTQLQYTLYRYTLNPSYKRPFQLEAEVRLGAGLGLKIGYDEHNYISKDGDKEKQVLPSLPEFSVDASLLFSVTPIIKLGPASVRYTFEVDTSGQLSHILGAGIRL